MIKLLTEILEVLEFVHDNHVIHRDLKPSNIRRRQSDRKIILIDFGAVKELDVDPEGQTTLVIGTPGYAPPEQLPRNQQITPEELVLWKQSQRQAKLSNDIYPVGVIAIQALTGFTSKDMEKMLDLNQVDWQDMKVTPSFKAILKKMVDNDPDKSYPTAKEALEAVQNLGKMGKLPTIVWAIIPSVVIIGVILGLIHRALNVDNYISAGEKTIDGSKIDITLSKLYPKYQVLKKGGTGLFAQSGYSDAVDFFAQIPSHISKDPESLIFRNNALVRHRHSQKPSQPIYTIATVLPLNLDSGLHILYGVAQAQDVAVKNGLNLQVIIANDNNQPQQAQQIAQALTNNPAILGVVGHYTSPNTCAALPIYSSAYMPLIAPTSTVVNLASDCQDVNKVFYRTVSSTRVEAETLVKYLVEHQGKSTPKIVVFYNPQEKFSRNLYEQFKEVVKAYNGSVAEFDLSKFQNTSLPSEVKNADAIALLADGNTDNSQSLEKSIQIINLNQGKKRILGSNPLYIQEIINYTGDNTINRLFIATHWHPQQCGAQKFKQEINQYWGGDLNQRTATAYEAVQALSHSINSIKLSSTPQVTRQALREKLSATGIRPETAPSSGVFPGRKISFDARGDRTEDTTRTIISVNQQRRFYPVQDVACSN